MKLIIPLRTTNAGTGVPLLIISPESQGVTLHHGANGFKASRDL